jgi:8-oxo-dGTP pyrophosphatase MutT (NUDIX family)
MGLRAAIGNGLVRVAKVFGGAIPAPMAEGEQASGMTPASPFGPGSPVRPYDGYERVPRSHEFVPGYNISARPRLHERVAFSTLTGLVEAYDIAQICIWHRIDSLRSLDWKLVAKDGYNGDVTGAIERGNEALKRPDGIHKFNTWFAKWMYDVLAYDAGTLYRLRNRDGSVRGLAVVDGTTIAPLQDYWGNPPPPPAEAYVQYINGLPWNWLTRNDLVYEPFRPIPRSLYGRAPLETILLNANTDLRFQLYFLEKFTDGNIPAAFASAPESWSPEQIEQFQEYWDGYMLGDQTRKHQVRWMPGGSKFAWSNEKDFQDHFSLFLMRKTLAAYHTVPADLGFTENVNRSSGESQADVVHKVGEAPLENYVEGIIDSFLQDDLMLPIRFQYDRGEEQDDRADQANADKVYFDMGAIGASEIRQMRYGLAEPEGRPVPRVIMSSRGGPIPLASLYAVAGEIDQETGAPAPGAVLPRQVFGGVEGVLPNPPLHVASLAEQEFGPSAMPPQPPPQPPYQPPATQADAALAKEGAAAAAPAGPAAPGIMADTGLYSYDLDGDEDEQPAKATDEAGPPAAVAKAELAAFRRYSRARRRAGTWRDFDFRAVDPVRGHRLNDAGRLAVRKAAGEVAVAGLAVYAADTGRVLMLQRALTEDDPAAGTWEFPGGHLEDGETPLRAAWREWAEETGCMPPAGEQTGTWVSPDGVYQGIVWTVDCEASVPVRGDSLVPNPDDPDGDQVEAIAWWDPAQLAGNPALRAELAANLGDVLAALGCDPDGRSRAGADGETPSEGDEAVCPCGRPVVYDEGNGWQHDDGSISHDDGESVSQKMSRVAKAGKVSKASVNYRPARGPHRCASCVMYRPDDTDDEHGECTLVEGPIDAEATCDRWYSKVAKAGGARPKALTRPS